MQNFQGSSLVPNLSEGLGTLRQGFGTPQSRKKQKQEAELRGLKLQGIKGALESSGPNAPGSAPKTPDAPKPPDKSQSRAMERLAIVAPEAAKAVNAIRTSNNEEARERFQFEAEKGARQAALVSRQKDFAGKQKAINSLAAAAAARGEPLDRFIELLKKTEPELNLELQRMDLAGRDIKTVLGDTQGRFTKGTGVIVDLPDGRTARSVPILNQRTGELENRLIPLGGDPVSRLGESGEETSARRVREAGGRAAATRGVELKTAGPIAAAGTRARSQETRAQGIINKGLEAADSIPNLNRALELLNSVETGGIDRLALAVNQMLGIESANEAELSSSLGKAVLSQLRDTFGAQFTEGEGRRLQRIEAGFGKSPAGNRRLLRQTKALMERIANRAIRAAERTGDTDQANEIREAMEFSLTPNETAPTNQPTGGDTHPEGSIATSPTGEQLIKRGGVWLPL